MRRSLRGFVCALSCLAPLPAQAAGDCKFPPVKPVILKHMGPCQFDPAALSFAGDARRQAACLTAPVFPFGKIGGPREDLPPALADFVGTAKALPQPEALRQLLQQRGLEADFGPVLMSPVARAQDGEPLSRPATYFVIHDTSSPNYLGRSWPPDIDRDASINNLGRYACANKIERAHVFINRSGSVMLAHDLDVPWRATKFEMAVGFGTTLKGLFLHAELVQPRRRAPGRGRSNDFLAPNPGFSAAQYDSLALVYTVASLRAGFWLIPAFHAVVDDGIYDKHDDPQNFDLAAFADSIDRLRQGAQRLAAGQPGDEGAR